MSDIRINIGLVKPGDVVKYILSSGVEHTFLAAYESYRRLPPNTVKAWVNGELRVNLYVLSTPTFQITDGPIISENITIDQRYVFEQKIKILTEALEYFANNLWTKPELQGLHWKDAVDKLENIAKDALEKVKGIKNF